MSSETPMGSGIDLDGSPSDKRPIQLMRVALTLVWIASVLGFLWVVNASRYLRPGADDYCIGVRGAKGLVGGFLDDWHSWSGFVTPSFITNAVVGVPLAYLPLWAASSISFLSAAVAVGGLVCVALTRAMPSLRGRKLLIAVGFILPIAMCAWWAFLWMTYSPSGQSAPTSLALGLTHWQNLNSAYVIPTALLVASGIWLVVHRFANRYVAIMLSGMLGLLAGFMGPTFGLATAGFCILLAIGIWILRVPGLTTKVVPLFIGAVVGVAAALAAPGTKARSSLIDPELALGPTSIAGWIGTTLPDVFVVWINSVLTWASVFAVVLGLTVAFLWSRLSIDIAVNKTARLLLGLVVFWVLLAGATVITDSVTYGAYWHQASVAVLAFASLVMLGALVGVLISRLTAIELTLGAGVLLAVCALAMLGSLQDMTVSIADRATEWDTGVAGIPGAVEDREQKWVEECWTELVSSRELG